MKLLLAGGFLFIGGCVLYAIGTFGFANTVVQAYEMQTPMYLGVVVMIAGILLGIRGINAKD